MTARDEAVESDRNAAEARADIEREALALTNAEWREFQNIPEQGYSHRHWVDTKIADRVARALFDSVARTTNQTGDEK